MNYSTFLKKLKVFLLKLFVCKHKMHHPKISLLIPFSSKEQRRRINFKWLLEYWRNELPEAEIIIGKSHSKIFCKGEALNNAVKRSTGKVLVILDADAYLPGHVINHAANRILEELDNHLWYVPYRRLYRLTRLATDLILESDPSDPLRFPSPPPYDLIENTGHLSKYGHRYGAMIMMFPREAYETLGCFDERFKGWGGEDVALLRALDTLYGKHKTTKNDILHLWHPFIGKNYVTRQWEGQSSGSINSKLANEYHKATRHPHKMRELVDAGCRYNKKHRNLFGNSKNDL